MAGYDPEVGCPCGLRYECHGDCETSKFEGLINMAKAKESLNPTPNHNLREIAGRVKKLSYRDLLLLAAAVDAATAHTTAEILLSAADALESA